MTTTSYVAVWDTDAIAPAEQIIIAIKRLHKEHAVMSFPYDGRFFLCDKVSSDLFKRMLVIDILLKSAPVMRLMYGYHSVGGAYIVNKEMYMKAGGENENFYGWGPEDAERLKRLEIMNLQIQYSNGPLFHLWHSRGKNSWYANHKIEIRNRREFIETCKKSGFNQCNNY